MAWWSGRKSGRVCVLMVVLGLLAVSQVAAAANHTLVNRRAAGAGPPFTPDTLFPPVRPPTPVPPRSSLPAPPSDLRIVARVEDDNFGYKFDGRTFTRVGFLSGVNLGVTVPGREPGEVAVTEYVVSLSVRAGQWLNSRRGWGPRGGQGRLCPVLGIPSAAQRELFARVYAAAALLLQRIQGLQRRTGG
jgi:hypothetical protein